MPDLKSLSSATLRIAIKNHTSFQDLCKKYDSTASALEFRIESLYPHNPSNGEQLINKLKAIDYKRETQQERRNKQQERRNKHQERRENHINNTSNPSFDESTATLETLTIEERILSERLAQLEQNSKNLCAEHRNCIFGLKKLQGELGALRAQFEAKGVAFDQLTEKSNCLIQQINESSAARRSTSAHLSAIRRKIQASTVTVIAVYDDGSIETLEAKFPITLDDTGYEALYQTLRDQDDLQNLRMKDIRLLARVLQIVKNSTYKLKPIFDNDTLDPIFLQLAETLEC